MLCVNYVFGGGSWRGLGGRGRLFVVSIIEMLLGIGVSSCSAGLCAGA